MRIARYLLLPKKAAFHYIWRCINEGMSKDKLRWAGETAEGRGAPSFWNG